MWGRKESENHFLQPPKCVWIVNPSPGPLSCSLKARTLLNGPFFCRKQVPAAITPSLRGLFIDIHPFEDYTKTI